MSSYHRGLSLKNDAQALLLRFLVLFGDVLFVCLSYGLAYDIRFYFDPFIESFPPLKGVPGFSIYLMAFPIIVLSWVLALSWLHGYRLIRYSAIDEIIRIGKVALLATVLSMSAMFLYRENSYSRLVFLLGGGLSAIFLYVYRELLKLGYVFWVRRTGRPQRVLIIGNGYLSHSLKKILEKQGDRAVLSKNVTNLEMIRRTIDRSRIHEVLVAHKEMGHKTIVQLATLCEERNVKFRLLPDILEIRMGEIVIDESLGVPTFQLKSVSLYGSAFFTKRVMDFSIAGALLIIGAIPLFIIGVLIKATSKGPIFFHQERMGYKGRVFKIFKFRTMIQNADAYLEDLKAKSDRAGPVFKMKSDPRITPIGAFLRKWSLDEIPQLINVLRGEMSIIGPRPQVLWETNAYDEWAKKRLNVLPGITGLWQVSGRAELTYEEMIELDIYYIEHWSPGLDIKILFRTLPAVLLRKGAY